MIKRLVVNEKEGAPCPVCYKRGENKRMIFEATFTKYVCRHGCGSKMSKDTIMEVWDMIIKEEEQGKNYSKLTSRK